MSAREITTEQEALDFAQGLGLVISEAVTRGLKLRIVQMQDTSDDPYPEVLGQCWVVEYGTFADLKIEG